MMKKGMMLAMSLILVMSLAACGKTVEPSDVPDTPDVQQEENESNMANPYTEYETLEEINELTGGNIRRPAVMGVNDETYSVMDGTDYKMAQYNFTVNGTAYSVRFAPVTEDISGVYVGDATAFAEPSDEELQIVATDTAKLARWLTIDGQYVLNVQDNAAMSEEDFAAIAGELMQATMTDMVNENGEN